MAHPRFLRRLLVLGLLCSFALPVAAQRPFRVYDPFYRNESARRPFYDGIAITGELSYRSLGELQGQDPALDANPLGLAFRLDYQLTDHLDVGAIVDASGSGRTLAWSWIVLTYHRTQDFDDYAFRLALDPASDGRVGFPQADLAFVASSLLSPVFSSDFAIGVRRVQRGYRQYLPLDPAESGADVLPPTSPRTYQLNYNRALGWEAHVMVNYSLHLSPSGTKFYAGLVADRGQYEVHQMLGDDLVMPLDRTASLLANSNDEPEPAPGMIRETYRGGVLWLRPGFEYSRPSFRLTPFLNMPLAQWTPEGHPRARPHLGVSLMLR